MSNLKTALLVANKTFIPQALDGYKEWEIVSNFKDLKAHIEINGVPDIIGFVHDIWEDHLLDYVKNGPYYEPNYKKYVLDSGLQIALKLCLFISQKNLILYSTFVIPHNESGDNNIVTFINNFKKQKGWIADCVLYDPSKK